MTLKTQTNFKKTKKEMAKEIPVPPLNNKLTQGNNNYSVKVMNRN
jgi:hypothetical protein